MQKHKNTYKNTNANTKINNVNAMLTHNELTEKLSQLTEHHFGLHKTELN